LDYLYSYKTNFELQTNYFWLVDSQKITGVFMVDEKVNTESDEKYKQLEARIHFLEVEKRVSKIHAKFPKFDGNSKSIDYLDGFVDCLSQMDTVPKSHAIAETVPKSQTKSGKAIGDVIDEDEKISSGESDL